MKNNFLIKHLWTIWQCCAEESDDGDSQLGNVDHGENFFLTGLSGNPDYQYKALSEIDVAAAKAEWDSLDGAEQRRQNNEFDLFVRKHYKELHEAANGKGREAFLAVVNKYL